MEIRERHLNKVCRVCGNGFSTKTAQKECSEECRAKFRREYNLARPKTPEAKAANKKYKLKAFYNMTPEAYSAMLERQGGVCAICGKKPGKRKLHVDHDHTCCPGKVSCGKCVRGLLCRGCNYNLLGQICRESIKGKDHAIEVLRKAIAYIS